MFLYRGKNVLNIKVLSLELKETPFSNREGRFVNRKRGSLAIEEMPSLILIKLSSLDNNAYSYPVNGGRIGFKKTSERLESSLSCIELNQLGDSLGTCWTELRMGICAHTAVWVSAVNTMLRIASRLVCTHFPLVPACVRLI